MFWEYSKSAETKQFMYVKYLAHLNKGYLLFAGFPFKHEMHFWKCETLHVSINCEKSTSA